MGAVIVDPITGSILARAFDQTKKSEENGKLNHPLHHATMLCIDEIAKKEASFILNKKLKNDQIIETTTNHSSYLCTGYGINI